MLYLKHGEVYLLKQQLKTFDEEIIFESIFSNDDEVLNMNNISSTSTQVSHRSNRSLSENAYLPTAGDSSVIIWP